MRKGTHMFNPWEINHNRADNAMFTYFKQHISNVTREHIVVTHGVLCLHWCDAAIGWCFRTGARQTWHRNDKKLPLKWLCYLLLEALKEKKNYIYTKYKNKRTSLPFLYTVSLAQIYSYWEQKEELWADTKGVQRPAQSQAMLAGFTQCICCLNTHFTSCPGGKFIPSNNTLYQN